MTIYNITIVQEREQQFYVNAPDRHTAEADGRELIDSLDRAEWVETFDPDVMASPVKRQSVPKGEVVWSGGEDGSWVDVADLPKPKKSTKPKARP